MREKTTVVAGPSGVGSKSSLTNLLQDQIKMETGEISQKLKREKAHNQALSDDTNCAGHVSG